MSVSRDPTFSPIVDAIVQAHTNQNESGQMVIKATTLRTFGITFDNQGSRAVVFSENSNQAIENIDFKNLVPDPKERARIQQMAQKTAEMIGLLIELNEVEGSSDEQIESLAKQLNDKLTLRGAAPMRIDSLKKLVQQSGTSKAVLEKKLAFANALACNASLESEATPRTPFFQKSITISLKQILCATAVAALGYFAMPGRLSAFSAYFNQTGAIV